MTNSALRFSASSASFVCLNAFSSSVAASGNQHVMRHINKERERERASEGVLPFTSISRV
jgi:hypothetical protein